MTAQYPPIRSFVRREGRITRAQSAALTECWSEFGVNFDSGFLDLKQLFGRECPVIVEIGFGNGRTLVSLAAQSPECNFLGLEVYRPGVGSLLSMLKKNGITNVKVAMEDAAEFLKHRIRESTLTKILIFFPDPWPKKRHHKRRLVQPEFLDMCTTRLVPGGQIHIATDWEDYAYEMLAYLRQQQGLYNVAEGGGFAERPAFRPSTKFENRGRERGHGIWDLVFQREVTD